MGSRDHRREEPAFDFDGSADQAPRLPTSGRPGSPREQNRPVFLPPLTEARRADRVFSLGEILGGLTGETPAERAAVERTRWEWARAVAWVDQRDQHQPAQAEPPAPPPQPAASRRAS